MPYVVHLVLRWLPTACLHLPGTGPRTRTSVKQPGEIGTNTVTPASLYCPSDA